ncbi:GNAT family N-acetyltransferase [Paenibacillus endoradicis]|uniref:GNAT family N-acetyltransferase n=1 Tax=Paenibacillus endoradicis TaxID=2972487 RepID=UPI00215918C8|nr:GNAT family N-acetyltransferase [Paenibacillus endoradicis]MCR8657661.1 GNAT family N-acetyltransferase [Paenibacillus endoradicis]
MNWIKVETEQQLNEAIAIRFKVFVDEQGVDAQIEQDHYDELSAQCTHVLVMHDGMPVGTGRISGKDGIGKIQRVCALQQVRGLGAGSCIMEALETIAREKQFSSVKLGAQVHAQSFYEKLGYSVISDVFYEENIPHVTMQKELK